MRLSPVDRMRRLAASEEGFSMLFALVALFVSSLLVAAALTSASGDIRLSRRATTQNKAYYAAVAGIDTYQYQLGADPNYWINCPTLPTTKVPETTDESYSVQTLSSTTLESKKEHCLPNQKTNKQTWILENSGQASGTFRVMSTGTSGGITRRIVATFTHPGFLNYVYLSNYEILDPAASGSNATECEHYYAERLKLGVTGNCGTIVWAPKDKVNGPMHTNDAAAMCAEGANKPAFGRSGQVPPDKIEINGGHYAGGGRCSDAETFNGTYQTGGATLLPPETDNELLESAPAAYKFSGKTIIVLKSGSPNTMTVTNNKGETSTKNFPSTGVIYAENSSSGGCGKYSPYGTSYTSDTGCGNIYVQGSYTESLTIAAANDIIVTGNLTTSAESSGKPTGAATLGLIATNYVRVYHAVKKTYEVPHYEPKTEAGTGSKKETCKSGFTYNSKLKLCVENPKNGYTFKESEMLDVEPCESFNEGRETITDKYLTKGSCEYTNNSENECDAPNLPAAEDLPNKWGAQTNPVIDAAILSTAHSFINDNFQCGANLGELTIWGSIAQFWRGTVGRGESGYIKNYNYDDRLAAEQPPSFLSPSTTSWKLGRETAPLNSFTG